MKKIYTTVAVALVALLTLPSCDSFLDVLPDSRTQMGNKEGDTEKSLDRLQKLLVSAYPTMVPMPIFEHRTDNVMDNGPRFSSPDGSDIYQNYTWQGNTDAAGDNTQGLWNRCYSAIATSNEALVALETFDQSEPKVSAIRGEALVTRAFSHFLLVNTFCQAYNKETSDSDLGIPYVTKPETKIGTTYERGTVASVYKQIDEDLMTGMALIQDSYSVPAYHFTKKATYAFAAKFYLYYEKWQLAKEYATRALGNNIAPQLRDLKAISDKSTTPEEWGINYSHVDNPANYLVIAMYSSWFRGLAYQARYGHHTQIMETQTLKSPGPWGNVLPAFDSGIYHLTSSAAENNFLAKYYEIFEITDAVAGIGYPHVLYVAFTSDETLLYRAEAEVLLGEYDQAAKDLSLYYASKGAPSNDYSVDEITAFYAQKVKDEAPVAKPLHPRFAIEEGTETNMLHAVLHARRIETIHSGQRWEDIKRYGIEITHNIFNAPAITLKSVDNRRAIQIPNDNISAGITPNP